MIVLGVDPGTKGAWALIDTETPVVVAWGPLPVVQLAGHMRVVDPHWLAHVAEHADPAACVVESQQAVHDPTRGRHSPPSTAAVLVAIASSAATLVLARSLPLHTVTPPQWKKMVGIAKSAKDAACDRVLTLFGGRFPEIGGGRVIRIAACEAALIAWAGWRRYVAPERNGAAK